MSFISGYKNTSCGARSVIFGGDNNIKLLYPLDNLYNMILGSRSIIEQTSKSNPTRRNILLGTGLKITDKQNQIVLGNYNEDKVGLLLSVGNGTSDADRNNAFEVLVDGRAKVQSAPTEANDVVRYQDVTTNLVNAEGVDSVILKYSGVVDDTHFGNTNTGESAVVFGEANNNSANCVLMAGKLNTNSSANAIVGGLSNITKAINGITAGQLNENYRQNAIVIGENNISNGGNSGGLIGVGLRQGNYHAGELIVGKYNVLDAGHIFCVGAGKNTDERYNALTVEYDGAVRIYNKPNHKFDVVRKLDIQDGSLLNIVKGTGTDSLVQTYSGDVDSTHYGNTNTGDSAVVFGEANNNSANRALLTGKMNTNYGANSVVAGLKNAAGSQSSGSITAGTNNASNTRYSFVNGENNTNDAVDSLVIGANNINESSKSIIYGEGNKSSRELVGSLVGGTYSKFADDSLIVIGNGSSDADRSNAFQVLRDGRAKVAMAPKDANDVVRKLEIDKKFDKAGGTISGDVAIQGNLSVSGKTTTLDTVTLQVRDNVILANADGTELVENAGFAMKTSATAAYGIMYDPVGDGVKIGLGAFNDAGKFVYAENEAQFLATRADSINDGNLPVWNNTKKSFEDSNVNVTELKNTVKALQEQVAALQEALAAITMASAEDIKAIFSEA